MSSFALYSCPVCLHITSLFAQHLLQEASDSPAFWAHVIPGLTARESLAPHYPVSWIFTVMPDFSYCSYSLLRFLRGAIIYSPILYFSVPHKISALLIQGLKPNICFLRLLKVGKLDRIWTHETQADFPSLLLCDPCKVLLVVDLRFLILIHCYYY